MGWNHPNPIYWKRSRKQEAFARIAENRRKLTPLEYRSNGMKILGMVSSSIAFTTCLFFKEWIASVIFFILIILLFKCIKVET